jgi:hypothetical protein
VLLPCAGRRLGWAEAFAGLDLQQQEARGGGSSCGLHEPSPWAPYGLVCYLAVTPMSINWKAPFAGILSQLNLGWRTDAGFTMPEALSEAQMELLHKYATCLRREGCGLEWSQLQPTDWFPSTSEADREHVSICNLDVDTCRDNTHRRAKLPPLGFVLSCQQRQESLFRRCAQLFSDPSAMSHNDLLRLMRGLKCGAVWLDSYLEDNVITRRAKFNAETLYEWLTGHSMTSLDKHRVAVAAREGASYARVAGFKCGEYRIHVNMCNFVFVAC